MIYSKRYFEDVAIGESLPPLEFAVTLTSAVMYAGATWDFHRYHYDAEFAQQAGASAPFMDGQMLGALVSRLLMQWGGADAFLRGLSYRQKSIVLVGDTLTITGTVDGKDDATEMPRVTCILSASNAKGEAVADRIKASLELPRRIAA
jgi:acyl dehydratase